MSDNGAWNDEEYRTDTFLRGEVSAPATEKETGTGIGRTARQASNRLTVADFVHAISYGVLDGIPVTNPERTIVAFPFHGRVFVGNNPANPKDWKNGVWLAVIEGINLGHIFDQIAEERRQSTHKGKAVSAVSTAFSLEGEEVTNVAILPFRREEEE